MTSPREEESRVPRHTCPECGTEVPARNVKNVQRRRRFSISRTAEANGHGPTVIEPANSIGTIPDRDSRDPHTLVDDDQTSSDRDQTSSDRDQTSSDRDQTSSDRDQTTSDRDQESSADDQDLADRELVEGSDPAAHRLIRLARDRTAAERRLSSDTRDVTAGDRRRTADERDQIADERDDLADERDRIAAGRDLLAATEQSADGSEPLAGDPADRSHGNLQAEINRARAAADRASAAIDRKRAATDRDHAIALRAAAAEDRAEAVRERNLAGIDQLTGVSLRSIGLSAVEREIQRARRTGRPLTLAFVDVNNLKAVNDTEGHLAGDVLLRRVADMLRMKLRPYDVIVRFGGDEFVCALANTGSEAVRRRFADIIAALERSGVPQPISFGLTELEEADDLEHLLQRADAALIEGRRLSEHRGRSDSTAP